MMVLIRSSEEIQRITQKRRSDTTPSRASITMKPLPQKTVILAKRHLRTSLMMSSAALQALCACVCAVMAMFTSCYRTGITLTTRRGWKKKKRSAVIKCSLRTAIKRSSCWQQQRMRLYFKTRSKNLAIWVYSPAEAKAGMFWREIRSEHLNRLLTCSIADISMPERRGHDVSLRLG